MIDELGQNRAAGSRALLIALALTLAVVGVEVAGGILTNSLALLADAGHMVTDVVAVSIALAAIWMARRPAGGQQTFGYQRAEVLAAAGLTKEQFRPTGGIKLDGARRPLRVPVSEPAVDVGTDDRGPFLCLAFALPPGAYATNITREICGKMRP